MCDTHGKRRWNEMTSTKSFEVENTKKKCLNYYYSFYGLQVNLSSQAVKKWLDLHYKVRDPRELFIIL